MENLILGRTNDEIDDNVDTILKDVPETVTKEALREIVVAAYVFGALDGAHDSTILNDAFGRIREDNLARD